MWILSRVPDNESEPRKVPLFNKNNVLALGSPGCRKMAGSAIAAYMQGVLEYRRLDVEPPPLSRM
jgi:hypothetical protein